MRWWVNVLIKGLTHTNSERGTRSKRPGCQNAGLPRLHKVPNQTRSSLLIASQLTFYLRLFALLSSVS